MYAAGATIRTMENDEMQELFGGMETLMPSFLTNLAYDVAWLCGRAIGETVYLISADRPPSPYAYAKVGYTN